MLVPVPRRRRAAVPLADGAMKSQNVRRIGSRLVLAAGSLLQGGAALGDLYTAGVLSFEWLVDSSDEIHRVRFFAVDGKCELAAEPLETLKPASGHAEGSPLATPKSLPPISRKPGEEWLLFFRRGKDGTPRPVQGINLTRPLEHFESAAITREGEPLRDRDTILREVKARIGLARDMPARCDRDAADKLISGEGFPNDRWRVPPPEIPLDKDPLGGPALLDRYVGCVRLRINCNEWDTGRDSLDTGVYRALVSVEPEDCPLLREAARLGTTPPDAPGYCEPVLALVNCPGEETEAILTDLIEYRGMNVSDSGDRRRQMQAREVRTHLHYSSTYDGPKPTDPLNKTLVGRWQLVGERELIDVDLEEGNTLTAKSYRRESGGKGPLNWTGRGEWVVRDGEMSIFRSYIRGETGWQRLDRPILKQKQILGVTPDAVILEGGPGMRLAAGSPTSKAR